MLRNRGKIKCDDKREVKFPLVPDIVTSSAAKLMLLFGFAVLLAYNMGYSSSVADQKSNALSKNNACSDKPMTCAGIPAFKVRDELGSILEKEKKLYGAELGVQSGFFAAAMMRSWPSCREYLLVDLWAPQENYEDVANVNQEAQDKLYESTLERTNEWKDKIRVCRNFTTNCVKNVPDGSLDYVYVDARHDFKGVYEDMYTWWPKLRDGGIMAGHDYVTQDDGPNRSGQDWTINYDGTKDETGTVVKGAVDKFSTEVCRQVTVSYREGGWNTWAIRK